MDNGRPHDDWRDRYPNLERDTLIFGAVAIVGFFVAVATWVLLTAR